MMMITIAMMIFQYQTRGGPRCAACLGWDWGRLDCNPQCCQGPNISNAAIFDMLPRSQYLKMSPRSQYFKCRQGPNIWNVAKVSIFQMLPYLMCCQGPNIWDVAKLSIFDMLSMSWYFKCCQGPNISNAVKVSIFKILSRSQCWKYCISLNIERSINIQ